MTTISLPVASYARMTDEQLIPLVIAGDQQAFAALYQRYTRLLQTVLLRYLNDPEAVQEVLQDAFLRAFRKMDHFRGESKFSTWLCRIAISIAISRRRIRRYASWAAMEDCEPRTLAAWNEGGKLLDTQDQRRLIEQAFRQLSEQDVIALDLFYFREQSIEEIGRHTGWTPNNVKSRLSRARQRLQKVMNEQALLTEAWT
ncbi:MAG TPA: sigma-70 family RNA polymerase sigma factor [Saprospiraceae bacterium]|nr:sigma-70 family RNA polymerase sigma factor [Saprospiraceae bacterium]